MSSSSEATSARPCASCRRLRPVCLPNCVFAPNFSTHGAGDYQFAVLHNVFGASNIAKLLAGLRLGRPVPEAPGLRPRLLLQDTSILRGVIGRLEWETLLPSVIRNKYALRRQLGEMAIRREQERQVATQQEKVMTTTQQQRQNEQTALQQLADAKASASEQETQEKMDELDAAAAGLTMEQYYAAAMGLDDDTLGHDHPHLQQEQAAAEQEQPTVAEQLEASLPPMTPTLFEGVGEGESSSDSDPPPDAR
ncbi:hypothetical protein PR202_ga28311 [Eleusine coracana subsp. coracana]|uniref:LOB domain-containing protein n=1 Tax=Eleusine coracana subsp. coracana TaxID=191504 RepID=A0AAV5DI84_ELECO|nr:hypothetical protein PR202_ga28311 [Eleusine coracana subsp. coracana]